MIGDTSMEGMGMGIALVYETHSISTDNEAGIATGWLPGELSVEGQRQAVLLGERRRDDGIAAVFVSDLHRAVQTAEIAFRGSSVPIVSDQRLRECNYGTLNGAPVEQVARERARHVETPFPGGQSYRDVVDQMAGFLEELAGSRDAERVLVVSHSANQWALDCLLNGAMLKDLVGAPFAWREGWEYFLPAGWQRHSD